MSSSEDQSREIQAFLAFAKAALLPLDTDAVEEPLPPAPDILAIVSGEQIAYEVTEAVEQDYAKKFRLIVDSPKRMREVYESLPDATRQEMEARHGGKLIGFCFQDDLSLKKREALLPSVFDFVLSVESNVGRNELERIVDPIPGLRHVSINDVGWDGIHWEVDPSASWIDPETALRNCLIEKMTNKSYETEHPIELVVYFWREVAPPPNTGWIHAMTQVAEQLLMNSPFRRVWLYDGWAETVETLADGTSK